MLIKNARIDGHPVDLRIDHTVQAMARHLEVAPNETVLRPTILLIATSGQEHSVSVERC
jgi:uncharacterized membrane protein YjjP (DUF1212 family)